MRTIKWSFFTNSHWGDDHLDCIKPLISENYEPLHTLIKNSIELRKGATFLKCPAYTDFLKNTFIFRAPFDLTIDLEVDDRSESCKIFCKELSQEQFDAIIDTRFLSKKNVHTLHYPIIGIDWLMLFVAEKSTQIQVLPAFMHYNDFTSKTCVIPGEYDISKWTRPVELVFEVRNKKEIIKIKKGDAISYIKFNCEEIIKLEKQLIPWEETKVCVEIRNSNQFRPLKERYKALEEIRKSGCPYESNN